MNTLIAYGTKYGCTDKVANILSQRLSGKVELCNLKSARSVDLSKYDRVIIGGSIYIGKVEKEVTEFCSRNLAQLKKKKVGLFICGLRTGKFAETELNDSFPQELVSKAAARECFGGELIFKKLNFIEKLITKMVSKADKSFPALDANNNVSTVSEERINRFARLMNSV